jgi:hypothetical protein
MKIMEEDTSNSQIWEGSMNTMIICSNPKTTGASWPNGKAPRYDTIWNKTGETPNMSGISRKRASVSSLRYAIES